ncbi:hypothetical protein NQ314_013722 [Rhamnusium bicolor]|uniref:THUMP domain-containing protein n=1 Tax=Rhamnusium bicolor TaxID=1586634 RepID=A0AAV8X589_9CUCU|nr:hypothetical protein NQ314_013722 [Rhamnusium bicolor]
MSKIQKPKYKQHFYKKPTKKSGLVINLKGFLCSCNNREKECVRESYNLLNKYADMLYPTQPVESTSKEDFDIEVELKKELSELRSNKDKRFQLVESGAKNFLFIKTTLDDPVSLAEKIVSDIEETKSQQTRFLIRLVPIEITCRAHVKDIENAFKPLALKYFKESPRTFSIVYNHRNNNSLKKEDVIKVVADAVFEIRADHKVNLKEAEVSIIIEVIKGIALLGVFSDF